MQGRFTPANPSRQNGASTLVMSTILLFAVSSIVVNAANLGLQEIKTSANSYRSQQALAASQAGMEVAIATLNKANTSVAGLSLSNLDGGGAGSYQVSISDAGNDVITVTSTGYSADGSATKSIQQKLVFGQILHPYAEYRLQAPLLASGDVNIEATNLNRNSASLLINAGGVVDANLSNDSSGLPPEVANDSNAVAEITLAKNRILENNPDLGDMYADIFANSDTTVMRHFAWQYNCAGTCSNPSGLIDSQAKGRFFVVNGSLSLSDVTIGSSSDPVVLYIDLSGHKSLSLSNTIINGIVYVKLDSGASWDNGSNSATINGVLVVDSGDNSNALSANNLTINYTLDNLERIGVYTSLPGSWTDAAGV